MKTYKGNIYPNPKTIFVFGSNPKGAHGAGSAKVAVVNFGAILGQGEGLQGQAYGLPTTILERGPRGMAPDEIIFHIKKMYDCARQHPDKDFKVAYRNQPNERTLCGYTGAEMIGFFKAAGEIPENVWFSEEWVNSGLFHGQEN